MYLCHILVWMYERISSVSCSDDIVAEYMAGLLLEHDKDYSPSLLSYQESINTNIEDTNPFEDDIQNLPRR